MKLDVSAFRRTYCPLLRAARAGSRYRRRVSGHYHHRATALAAGHGTAVHPVGSAGRVRRPGPGARLPHGRRARRGAGRTRRRHGQLAASSCCTKTDPACWAGRELVHQHHQRHAAPCCRCPGRRSRSVRRVREPEPPWPTFCPNPATRRAGSVRRLEGPVLPGRQPLLAGRAGRAPAAASGCDVAGSDATLAARHLWQQAQADWPKYLLQSAHVRRLNSLEASDDFAFCTQVDACADVLPRWRGDGLVRG